MKSQFHKLLLFCATDLSGHVHLRSLGSSFLCKKAQVLKEVTETPACVISGLSAPLSISVLRRIYPILDCSKLWRGGLNFFYLSALLGDIAVLGDIPHTCSVVPWCRVLGTLMDDSSFHKESLLVRSSMRPSAVKSNLCCIVAQNPSEESHRKFTTLEPQMPVILSCL